MKDLMQFQWQAVPAFLTIFGEHSINKYRELMVALSVCKMLLGTLTLPLTGCLGCGTAIES